MPKKQYTPEEIIQHLRTVELETSKELAVLDACRTLGQTRSSSRYMPQPDHDRARVRERILARAKEYGRYGYRTVTDLLRREGGDVGKDSVYTIWRHEGLQVPQKQPKRARLWRADGSCLRLRPAYRHHVWSSDCVGRSDAQRTDLSDLEYSRRVHARVSGLGGGPPNPLTGRAVDPGGSVSQSRDPDAYSAGQWAGVHRAHAQPLADRASGGAAL
ncbi:MAG: IS3 family transposase [Nitrospira sp. BO4]|jgi:hypothetical protein|nr:IS3 family transposase [Nitrospira sp. BO4]